MTLLPLILCSCFVGTALARTEAEIKTWFLQQALQCAKDFPVSEEEILLLEKHKIPDTRNAKCLLACMFKKTEWPHSRVDIPCVVGAMNTHRDRNTTTQTENRNLNSSLKKVDDKGMFIEENAVKMSEQEHPDEPAKVENAKKLFDLCKKVNEENISGADSECVRAAMLAKCLSENAPKMGFKLE